MIGFFSFFFDMINRNDMIFSLTADLRRRPQTFLPADPAGKKHINRYAINYIQVLSKIVLLLKPVCPQGMQVFLPAGRREEKILSAHVCVGLRLMTAR
jgi:hypothetical protein